MSQHNNPLGSAARAAAASLQHLAPGPLAELRRMRVGAGAPGFWRLAAQHPSTIGRRVDDWIAIIRILAILTPKGDPTARPHLNDSSRSLGAVLCDGGDPGWSDANPVFSERRLAQLMVARGPQRAVLLERAARAIARSRAVDSGIDVADLALVLLSPDDGRRLAEPYYRRLDRAERDAEKLKEGTS
jgi:CRISPR system Cascade subunit CasB